MEELNPTGRPSQGPAESEGPVPLGPGALLRQERHNRSMDIRQVADSTRLREHFIEAIERERWDELPPPVFVRGFIRSYARALGLNEQKVLDLYNRSVPAQPLEPQPLLKPKRATKGILVTLILTMGILAGSLLYVSQREQWTDRGGVPEEPLPPAGEVSREASPEPPEEVETAEPLPSLEEVPPEPVENSSQTEPAPSTGPETGEEESPPLPEMGALPPPPEQEPDPPEDPPEDVNPLEFEVEEETWVRIAVDGGPPKSFLFRPGSRPGWGEGAEFDLLIGNAGGINLIYEGKQLGKAGKSGEVIRLKLPRDLEQFERGEQ
jgi:cytoskeleton protein RodZ